MYCLSLFRRALKPSQRPKPKDEGTTGSQDNGQSGGGADHSQPRPQSHESIPGVQIPQQTAQRPSKDVIDRLRKLINQDLEFSCYSKTTFLPTNKIDEIATRENVESTLRSEGLTDTENLTNWVMGGAKRLFLVLIRMNPGSVVELLETLRKNEFRDDSLPVHLSVSGGVAAEKKEDAREFPFFASWDENDLTLFETHQWSVLAPIFSNEAPFYYNFNNRRCLPWLSRQSKAAGAGYFGEVTQVEMHRHHVPDLPQLDETSKGVAVAIKKAKHGEQLADFFDREVNSLFEIRNYDSPHVVKPIAAYQINDDRFLVFPWAAGGNFDAYWQMHENLREDPKKLEWLFDQISGLFAALRYIHHEKAGRHGDLKPDNILCFVDPHGKEMLQIADMGLTTFHDTEADTVQRRAAMKRTYTPSGHRRYEPPPEPTKIQHEARSRGYDIWSMGCILIELLVWLTSGYQAVKAFRSGDSAFWEEQPGLRVKYQLDHKVVSAMRTMEAVLKENTAYKDIFRLVKDRMLIVDLPSKYGDSAPGFRDCAEVVSKEMEQIRDKCKHGEYLKAVTLEYHFKANIKSEISSLDHEPADNKLQFPKTLSPSGAPISDGPAPPQIVIHRATSDLNSNTLTTVSSGASEKHVAVSTSTACNSKLTPYLQGPSVDFVQLQSSKIDDTWNAYPDNDFAIGFLNSVGWQQVRPEPNLPTLCEGCSIVPPRSLDGEQDLEALQASAKVCDLCAMLSKTLAETRTHGPDKVDLHIKGGTVAVVGGPPLLSLYTEPAPFLAKDAQLGLPKLLATKSLAQYSLLRHWIEKCDKSHEMCRRLDGIDIPSMPTRVMDLGHPLRLVDSASVQKDHYAALSHRWGVLTEDQKFCTYKRNIESMKTGVDVDRLPRSFQDAVIVARELGVKYLWIDSICIIQDDEEDWKAEAGKMEQVFSGAHFTIGATVAESSLEGFIRDRDERPCLRLPQTKDGALYICPAIDNFHRDVELAELNQRGWVLQERALSRRSIHFTSTQMYWECGAGVHCETMAHLDNSKAAFIGDANFPKSALEYYRDGRQVLVQNLYERYSGLAFTKPKDRAVAILGLQKRLARAFRTRAAYGCLADYFARGLLWQRQGGKAGRVGGGGGSSSEPVHMAPIGWDLDSGAPPSWSWLSKSGPIRYMDLKFEKIDWASVSDFTHPFVTSPRAEATDDDLYFIRARARGLNLSSTELLSLIDFDTEPEPNMMKLRCVVIGRDKVDGGTLGTAKQYVLVIRPTEDGTTGLYERVGAGSLSARHIQGEGDWVTVC